MKAYELLKDKLAYFGGYKWLPYVDAVELVEEKQRLQTENRRLKSHLDLLTEKNINLELELKEIQRIYEYGQPDNNGEVMVEVEDTCDTMYKIAINALEKESLQKENSEIKEAFKLRGKKIIKLQNELIEQSKFYEELLKE